MRKIILYNLLTVLLLASCSTDSEDDIQKDELLSNTEWIDSHEFPIINPSPETPPPIEQILAYIYIKYPPISSNNVTIDEVELEESDVIYSGTMNESRIRFTDNQCFYSSKDISSKTERKLKTQYMRVKLTNQEGRNRDGIICRILPDGIYLIDESLPMYYPERQRLFIKLENYEYKEKKSFSVISQLEKKEVKNETNVALSFNRVGNEIIIRNDSIEWEGVLNENKNMITIEQITPQYRSIGEFKKN